MNTRQRRLQRRAFLTAVDRTRGQTTRELAERLRISAVAAWRHTRALEMEGLIMGSSTLPILWRRS